MAGPVRFALTGLIYSRRYTISSGRSRSNQQFLAEEVEIPVGLLMATIVHEPVGERLGAGTRCMNVSLKSGRVEEGRVIGTDW